MPIIPITYPMINGHRYSWSSCEFHVAPASPGSAVIGAAVRGIKSADYDHSLTPTKIRGNGPDPMGRTRGEYDAKASLELYRLEYENVKAMIMQSAPPGSGFGEIAFTLLFQYADLGQPVTADTLEGCRVENPAFGGSEGADALTVRVTLNVMRILENGIPLFSARAGGF